MASTDRSKLGRKIRELRKGIGLTMQQLAERVGVNYTTIYRVETGKVSPSVVLLSDIAHQLGHSILTLLQEERAQLTVIKSSEQPVVESEKMQLRLLVPKGLIDEQISISLGKARPGVLRRSGYPDVNRGMTALPFFQTVRLSIRGSIR